jgi:hypothetical protein
MVVCDQMLPTGNLSKEDGIFCFEHNDKLKHAAYMPLERIEDADAINVGHFLG